MLAAKQRIQICIEEEDGQTINMKPVAMACSWKATVFIAGVVWILSQYLKEFAVWCFNLCHSMMDGVKPFLEVFRFLFVFVFEPVWPC